MDKSKVISRMMRAFNANYSGWKIDTPVDKKGNPILDKNGIPVESKKSKLWNMMLAEFDTEVIEKATIQIIATRKGDYAWAPDLATVREQCLNLQSGILDTPSGSEAWGRILRRLSESTDSDTRPQLTDDEKKILEMVGGKSAEYDMRRGIKDAEWVGRSFIKEFDREMNRQRVAALTPASVKALVQKNAPQLPAPESKQLPHHEEPEYLDPAKITELCKGVVNKIGVE